MKVLYSGGTLTVRSALLLFAASLKYLHDINVDRSLVNKHPLTCIIYSGLSVMMLSHKTLLAETYGHCSGFYSRPFAWLSGATFSLTRCACMHTALAEWHVPSTLCTGAPLCLYTLAFLEIIAIPHTDTGDRTWEAEVERLLVFRLTLVTCKTMRYTALGRSVISYWA